MKERVPRIQPNATHHLLQPFAPWRLSQLPETKGPSCRVCAVVNPRGPRPLSPPPTPVLDHDARRVGLPACLRLFLVRDSWPAPRGH